MRTVAVIQLDIESGALGLPCLAFEKLAGGSVLRHTLERICSVDAIDRTVLAVRSGRGERPASEAAEGLPVELAVGGWKDVPHREALQRSRKWSVDMWRGGIGYATMMDEEPSPYLLAEIGKNTGAEAVVSVSPTQMFIDPEILADMIAWHETYREKVQFTFAGCAPGLTAEIYHPVALQRMCAVGKTIRDAIRYRPEKPEIDPAFAECNCKMDEKLRLFATRLSVDSRRYLELARAIVEELGWDKAHPNAGEIVDFLSQRPDLVAGRLPREVEIEVTSRTNARSIFDPDTHRCPETTMSLGDFSSLVTGLDAYDDVTVTLGGFGEPLLHPDLPELVAAARRARVWGVHIATNGLALEGALVRKLLGTDVDCISVALEAHSPEVYRRVWGSDAYDNVRRNVEAAIEMRNALGRSTPFIIPTMRKGRENFPDMEAFYNEWYTGADWVAILPPDDFAGQIPDRALVRMSTSRRIPCRKLLHTMFVFADGSVPFCRQDLRLPAPVGNALETSPGDLWTHPDMVDLRDAHLGRDYGRFRLCSGCGAWYYP